MRQLAQATFESCAGVIVDVGKHGRVEQHEVQLVRHLRDEALEIVDDIATDDVRGVLGTRRHVPPDGVDRRSEPRCAFVLARPHERSQPTGVVESLGVIGQHIEWVEIEAATPCDRRRTRRCVRHLVECAGDHARQQRPVGPVNPERTRRLSRLEHLVIA